MPACALPPNAETTTVLRVVVREGFNADLMTAVGYEHIYWDQANVLVQIGLLDPTNLPVVGVGAARKLLDPTIPDPFFGES